MLLWSGSFTHNKREEELRKIAYNKEVMEIKTSWQKITFLDNEEKEPKIKS